MSFEIEGRLHRKFETENKTSSFQAREFVLEINSNNYLQYIKFQLTQDRCQLADPYSEGDKVKVHFDLRGREWNGKYFTNLNVWKIEGLDSSADTVDSDFDQVFPDTEDAPVFEDQEDDLPF